MPMIPFLDVDSSRRDVGSSLYYVDVSQDGGLRLVVNCLRT